MQTKLTDERLREIREREQKATAGPWRWSEDCTAYDEVMKTCSYPQGMKYAGLSMLDEKGHAVFSIGIDHYQVVCDGPPVADDRAFIAHARADIPLLLAAIAERDETIKRQRELIEIMKQEVKEAEQAGENRDGR